jgi:hypothetical protein
MKKLVLTVMLLVLAVMATAVPALALNITSSGSRTLTASLAPGTSAIFIDDPGTGLRITCTTHTLRILTTSISTIGDTTDRSTATSAIVHRANSSYTSSVGTAPPLCDYTVPIVGSGSARADITSDKILTLELPVGTITFPASNNTQITLTTGGLRACTLIVTPQSIRMTVSSNANRTIITMQIRDRTFTTTNTGCGFARSTSTHTETLVLPTTGLS